MRLTGMKQITQHFQYSESTILKLIHEQDFPARKISGGIWESDTDLIDNWRKDRILMANGITPGKRRKR